LLLRDSNNMTVPLLNTRNIFSSVRRQHTLVIELSVSILKLAVCETVLSGLRLLCYEIKVLDTVVPFVEQVVQLIKDFIARHRQIFGHCDVVLSISQVEGVFVKYLVLPHLPVEEIIGAAKWQIKEEVAFDLETASVDFQKVFETTDQQGVHQHGYVFYFVQKEILDTYLEICQSCYLNVKRVTIAAFDYGRIIEDQKDKQQAVVVLDINEKNAFLSIYWQHRLVFLRRLPISWEKVLQAMLEPVVSDQKNIRLSLKDIERIKGIPGLLMGDTEALNQDIPALHAVSLLRPFLETMVREIRFSIAYFGSALIMDKPKILYLTGSISDLKDLQSYLTKELDLQNVVLPTINLSGVGEASRTDFIDHQKRLLPVLGAALNGPEGINLLPVELKQRISQQAQWMILRLVMLSVSLLLFCLLGFLFLQQKNYQRQIENARIHLQAMNAIQQMNAQIVVRKDLWQKIVRNKVPGDMVLRVISSVIPNGIILDQIHFDQLTKEVKISGSLVVSMSRQGQNQLIDFVQRLDESNLFLSATLLSTKKSIGSDQFEISCVVASGI
jgi:Tfp pilus assembly PilM family ATPase